MGCKFVALNLEVLDGYIGGFNKALYMCRFVVHAKDLGCPGPTANTSCEVDQEFDKARIPVPAESRNEQTSYARGDKRLESRNQLVRSLLLLLISRKEHLQLAITATIGTAQEIFR